MIEITAAQMDRAALLLRNIPGALPKAIYHTLNRAITTVKAKAATEISRVYRISSTALKDGNMRLRPATETSLSASITFAGNVIPLIQFQVSRGKSGMVRASVMRKGGQAALKRAFVANPGHGEGVFERVADKRFPIQQLYGPSIAHMAENADVLERVAKAGQDTINNRLEHEITRMLNGYGG